MTAVQDNKLAEACSILFGDSFAVDKSTIEYLQLSGIKHAFRERAKECHPDITGDGEPALQENFLKLKDAYDFLISAKSAPKTVGNPKNDEKTIPNRKLRLGEYLYYTGKISWKELIAAITWQRQNSDGNKSYLFGLYFIKKGILTSSELGFSVFKQSIHNSNY
ncbi:MAG: J domain-containing protein [Spirochaetales bacterium]|uniref:J domain-containing protein n=1 Tax=Candidatus Thalassospirochaeta sargassi TaxID=3119039 RepID=A0AAJ1IBI5_9SPIO|nr:J domain-containing protein [Spirochaetales bacterium]